MSLWPVLSQKTYPGVGDWDECWMMATIWAAEASDPCFRRARPSVYSWRKAAGDPDDGYRDGGTLNEMERAVDHFYPTAKFHRIETRYWDTYKAHLGNAHPSSLAVNSAHLPSRMRYGFLGGHQVGVWRSPTTGYIYLMNPLADQGTRPQRITGPELKYAAMSLPGGANGWVLAGCFTPIPVHLHYGGSKLTNPFPDRTRIDSPTGKAFAYTRPDMADRNHRYLAPMTNGDLFTAYQRATGSRGLIFYGDHRGTKWVNAARLAYKHGDT